MRKDPAGTMTDELRETRPIEPLRIAREVAARLAEIPGVVAVALGGSRARGADDNSDVDLGIYYRASNPPPVERLRSLAREIHRGDSPAEVTGLGEWGPWVNGGAWLQVQGRKVDWLYRDIDRVMRVIEECLRGVVTCDYYLGHPHGFHNHIYLAEVYYCHPLQDHLAVLDRLKERLRIYPSAMKTALMTKFLYEARFMLELARPGSVRCDVFHVSGCLFRCAAALVQVLFALNEMYFMNEKGALSAIKSFPIKPDAFPARVRSILASPGHDADTLHTGVAAMDTLIAETYALAKAAIS
jgi:predicted nucleotidyltransferase